jgi:hypothetical protein
MRSIIQVVFNFIRSTVFFYSFPDDVDGEVGATIMQMPAAFIGRESGNRLAERVGI